MLALDEVADRVSEVGWVTDHTADLESDLSAVHRVDDMWSMPGPKFLRLALRTVAYAGVMQARAQALIDAGTAETGTATPMPTATPQRATEGTRDAVEASPRLSGLIDWDG